MSPVSFSRAVLFLSWLAGTAACAQQTSSSATSQRLLILSKNDQLLSIVDPATLKIVGQVAAGPDPHEVVASDDGKRAYISNYGGGAYNTLTIVDLVNQKSLGTVDLGALRGPHGLHFVGGKVWFTAEAAKAIGSYDPATSKIDLILGSGEDGTHMIYAFPDQARLVTTNIGSGTITIFEKRAGPRPNWSATTVATGPRGLARRQADLGRQRRERHAHGARRRVEVTNDIRGERAGSESSQVHSRRHDDAGLDARCSRLENLARVTALLPVSLHSATNKRRAKLTCGYLRKSGTAPQDSGYSTTRLLAGGRAIAQPHG